jgi:prefoldin subunit 5
MAELKSLESRCENLKYMTREEMQKRIIEVNQEIESLRANNKELTRGNTLNGLNICRG